MKIVKLSALPPGIGRRRGSQMRGFFKRGQIGKTDLEKEGIIAATAFGRYYWPQEMKARR
jgi:hypothetical protein